MIYSPLQRLYAFILQVPGLRSGQACGLRVLVWDANCKNSDCPGTHGWFARGSRLGLSSMVGIHPGSVCRAATHGVRPRQKSRRLH